MRPPQPTGGSRRAVAFFCMPERGHFQRLRALVSGVTRAGHVAHVFTHADFRQSVEHAGGVFHDVFATYPLAAADDTSFPIPCRYVSFAGRYADAICDDARRLGLSLVVHDSFAVIGRVVASALDVPRVNVISGHQVVPSAFIEALERNPVVHVSAACARAVETLRSRYGLSDASPFCYVASPSSELNICCEPPQFLGDESEMEAHPLEFFGSLPDDVADHEHDPRATDLFPTRTKSGPRPLKVYASFGTVVWRRYADVATRAVQAVAAAARGRRDLALVVSLGGATLRDASPVELAAKNIRIADFVDQWETLRATDVFLTHNGLNSTHEAVFHRVPMLSYPFFWDQPAMATTCARLGIARPLADAPRAALDPARILLALDDLAARRDDIMASLGRARQWELDVIANRPAVIARMLGLAS